MDGVRDAALLERLRGLLADVPLRPVRQLRGETPQVRIAAKSRLSQAHVSDLEQGRRELTPEAAEKLGPALGLGADELLAADVLAGLKQMAAKSPQELDPRLLVEIVEYLDAILPENEFNDSLMTTLLELAEERLAAYRQQRSSGVATKSAREQEGRRDSFGRRRRKPYGLGGR